MIDTQAARREAFARLIERYHQSPEDYDEGEEEDPRPYLSGEEALAPWICVTVNYTSHGEPKFFFLPFEDDEAAMSRAVEFAADDLFEELPVAVVNLDNGHTRWPIWASLEFTP